MTALAQHLRRRTTSGNWVPELDGLRFIAIAAVLLFHMQGELGHHGLHEVQPRYAMMVRVFDKGNRGVQLFFVISGYILARPFAAHHLFGKPRPSLRKYFARRVTRLEPPYLLNLLACAVALAALGHTSRQFVLKHFITSAVYLHYVFFHDKIAPLNSVAWSLEVEVQFYILAPLLTLIFMVRSGILRRGLLIASMLGSAALQSAIGFSIMTLAGQLQYFLAGLLFADLAMTMMKGWSHSRAWDVVSLAGWPLLFFCGRQFQDYWMPFLILLLCVAAFRGRVVYAFLRLQWIAIFGGMCYTIYLRHPLVFSFVQRLLDRVQDQMPTDYGLYFLLQAVPKTVAVAAVSILLFALVERPCMDPNWPRKLRAFFRERTRGSAHPSPAVSLKEF